MTGLPTRLQRSDHQTQPAQRPAMHLPEELVLHILSQPSISVSRESVEATKHPRYTLYNACLASKACYRIAQPRLFECIDVRKYGCGQLVSFLWSLMRRPESAPCIRELRMSALTFDSLENWPKAAAIDWDPLKEDLACAIDKSFLSSRLKSSLQFGLLKNNPLEDVYLAMFFLTCPRLERWPISFYESKFIRGLTDWLFTEVSETMRLGMPSPEGLPFKHLCEINARHHDINNEEQSTFDSFDIRVLSLHLQSPSVKTLHASQASMSNRSFFSGGPGAPNIPSNIEHITLFDGYFHHLALRKLLAFYPHLKTLDNSGLKECGAKDAIKSLGVTLEAHAPGLEKLKLHVYEAKGQEDSEQVKERPIASLKRLESSPSCPCNPSC